MPYILEVQRFNNGESEHIGYINNLFNTKEEACNYYDKYNPHMRSLNAHDTWCSDWDPRTRLMYIVREHFYECLKVSPFEDNDNYEM